MKNLFFTFAVFIVAVINLHSQESSIDIKADIVYGHKYGMALSFDVYTPVDASGAAVLFINSGGFESGKIRYYDIDDNGQHKYLKKDELKIFPGNTLYPPLAQFSIDELLQNGFTVFDIRHGSSPKFKLDEIVEDCKLATTFIITNARKYNLDPDRIGLFGASAGGYIAEYLATTEKGFKTTVLFYPAGFDYIELKNGSPEVYNELPALHLDEAILDSLSIKNQLSADDPSCLIIYGEEDFPFITEASKNIAAGLQKVGVDTEIISRPGVGHEFRNNEGYQYDDGEYARLKMVDWFKKELNSK